MSCMTELLALKGDMDTLLISSMAAIEGGGIYKGYEYLITFTAQGIRCGYVALKPKDAEIFQEQQEKSDEAYYLPDLDCHGGITFYDSEHQAKNLLPIPCNDVWVGFDCGHAGDAYSPDLARKYFGKAEFSDDFYESMARYGFEECRSYEYVEEECQSIIDQLINQTGLKNDE